MLYMVVEHFLNDDPLPVYRRFRDHGRLAPKDCTTSRGGWMRNSKDVFN